MVIGNHDDLEPLAAHYGLEFHDIGDEKGIPDEGHLLELLDEYETDLVVLARYMRILGPEVVFRYEDRIINVHPSLLPAFPGAEAYRQAREDGVRIAGVTAHYVTTDLDQGPHHHPAGVRRAAGRRRRGTAAARPAAGGRGATRGRPAPP